MSGAKGPHWGVDIYLDPSVAVGAIPYKGANGKLLWLTPGAASQVITSNGVAPAIPSYQAGSGGGGGSGAVHDMIGSAAFNASTGAIVGLAVAGVVASVSRISAGRFQVTFASAEADANYDAFISSSDDNVAGMTNYYSGTPADYTTTGFKFYTTGASPRDPGVVRVSVFRYGGTTSVNNGEMLISEQSLTTTTPSVDFSSIAQTYRDLRVVVRGRSNNASDNVGCQVRLNGDTGANYDWQTSIANVNNSSNTGTGALAATSMQLGWLTGTSAPSGAACSTDFCIYDYRGTTFHKQMSGHSSLPGSTTALTYWGGFGGRWKNTAAVNQVTVFPVLGSFIAGTVVSLYGRM